MLDKGIPQGLRCVAKRGSRPGQGCCSRVNMLQVGHPAAALLQPQLTRHGKATPHKGSPLCDGEVHGVLCCESDSKAAGRHCSVRNYALPRYPSWLGEQQLQQRWRRYQMERQPGHTPNEEYLTAHATAGTARCSTTASWLVRRYHGRSLAHGGGGGCADAQTPWRRTLQSSTHTLGTSPRRV